LPDFFPSHFEVRVIKAFWVQSPHPYWRRRSAETARAPEPRTGSIGGHQLERSYILAWGAHRGFMERRRHKCARPWRFLREGERPSPRARAICGGGAPKSLCMRPKLGYRTSLTDVSDRSDAGLRRARSFSALPVRVGGVAQGLTCDRNKTCIFLFGKVNDLFGK